MHHCELGTSGIEINEVGFSAWVVRTDWWGDRSDEDSIEISHHAIEQGIDFFDTGDMHGHGHSEEVAGGVLADYRDEIAVATKIGYDFYNNPQADRGELSKEITGEWVREVTEKSLERLDMGCVDLLQPYSANIGEVISDALEVLNELEEEGPTEATNWALGPSTGWLAGGGVAIGEEFDTFQIAWNAFE